MSERRWGLFREVAQAIRRWAHEGRPSRSGSPPRIGLALGGGFARSLAHVGVLRVFEQHHIPVHAIAGISSGAIIASTYASGTPLEDIISSGAVTTFNSYARWTLSRLGLASNERMEPWLLNILQRTRFEEMRIPLAIVATDLVTGRPVIFRERGDIIAPVRASCAYPGLFLPVQIGERWLVDGAIASEVPTEAVRALGATHVVGVYLHSVAIDGARPTNMFQVVSQCFAILQERLAGACREGNGPPDLCQDTNLLLEPAVGSFAWDDFGRCADLVRAGEEAALAALPVIQGWLKPTAGTRAA